MERSASGFINAAVGQMERLVPFDQACCTVSTVNFWKPRVVIAWYSGIWEDYFSYYGGLKRLPPSADPSWPSTAVIDPAGFGDAAFNREFAETHRTAQTLIFSSLPETAGDAEGFTIGLCRGRRPAFRETELAAMRLLYPHLRNIFSFIGSPDRLRRQRLLEHALRAGFTRREREISEYLCERWSIPEIAERLFVSRHTVEKHLEHVYAKLRASGRRAACNQLLGGEEGGYDPYARFVFDLKSGR